jgi:rhodanese-related sulfurtransferase
MAKSIALAELQELIARGAQLVEVLPAGEYSETHLPGAINLPLKQLDARSAATTLDARRAVIVYCWDSL